MILTLFCVFVNRHNLLGLRRFAKTQNTVKSAKPRPNGVLQLPQSLIIFLLVLLSCQMDRNKPKRENMSAKNSQEDAYLWLEEIQSESSIEWVKEQNALSAKTLEGIADFEPMRERLLSVLNSKERIPYIVKSGKYCYNFWRDDSHVRGLWRRTSLENYVSEDPAWEIVLDLDALSLNENENWVWKGCDILYPTYDRCLVFLSRGGTDALVVREFDLESKQFIADGFCLPEAKSRVSWKDRDTLYVSTDFGPQSLTDSGYPRIIKEWTRGTHLADAKLVFEGNKEDVSVSASVVHDHGHTYEFIHQSLTFFTDDVYLRKCEKWHKLDKPADTQIATYGEFILFSPRFDWTIAEKTYSAGTLLAIEAQKYLEGDRFFHVLFEPTDQISLVSTNSTKNFLILNVLENVRNKIFLLKYEKGSWSQEIFEIPAFGSTSLVGIDSDASDEYFMVHSDYLTPASLWMGDLKKSSRSKIKSLPAYFNAEGLEIAQYEAISKDGTHIPYFQVSSKQMPLDGNRPTLLYGYGGFEISLQPAYQAMRGCGWLEQGGVYVEANIRGGGEFGPKWHNAARKENRQRAYDDFIAVAEDLIARKVTSPAHLGIQGGSNGGLLMGVMLTQRPDLWKAVLCQVPLLDMKRYHKLLAGASWIDEYGNPDNEVDWAFIQKYSPYHNLRQGQDYPHVFFTTSTRDDRVHPAHARKMAAKMLGLGYPVLYYENIEGGHAGATNNEQIAYKTSLEYMFLMQELVR